MAVDRTRQARRCFLQASLALALLGLVSGCGGVPWLAPAPRLPRIGFLGLGSTSDNSTVEFLAGLRDLGYVEGQNISIEWRFAEGRLDRLSELAAELVQVKPDILVAGGSTPPAVAAKQAASTIPIVFMGVSDPIGAGLVATLASPAGNATGTTTISPEVSAKSLQMVKEILPSATRVDYMMNFGNQAAGLEWEGAQEPARQLGLTLRQQDVRDAGHVDQVAAAMASGRPDAMIVIVEPLIYAQRQRIVDLAFTSRVPLITNHRELAELGGVLMYGPGIAENFRPSAGYVDKILKGAKPAELPVQRPTRIDVVVNLKAAQALGVTIPQSVLQQATELIQ